MKILDIEGSTKIAVVMEKEQLADLLHRIKWMSKERFIHFGCSDKHATGSLPFYSELSSKTMGVFNWRGMNAD